LLFDKSVPFDTVCQYHTVPAGGVPRVTITSPQVLLDLVGVAGVVGGVPLPSSIGRTICPKIFALIKMSASARKMLIRLMLVRSFWLIDG
jgi:hypothetical protein